MVRLDKPRKDLADVLLTLLVVGLSLYPMYRDDVARFRLRVEQWFTRRNEDAEVLAQVQREISLMEHGQ